MIVYVSAFILSESGQYTTLLMETGAGYIKQCFQGTYFSVFGIPPEYVLNKYGTCKVRLLLPLTLLHLSYAFRSLNVGVRPQQSVHETGITLGWGTEGNAAGIFS